jgi:hypothetical protein
VLVISPLYSTSHKPSGKEKARHQLGCTEF